VGDWTGTVPTFAAGAKLRGVDMATLAAIDTALAIGWTTWVPTLTNLTLASGTLTAKYRRVGKTVDFKFKFVYGAGSAVGTDPQFTLPVTPAAEYVNSSAQLIPIGEVFILDFGTTGKGGKGLTLSGSTVSIRYDDQATNAAIAITATVPWTWTTNDMLSCWGTYEAA